MNGLPRPRHAEFKRRLDELCYEAVRKPASSNKNPVKNQNPHGASREWWLENLGKCEPHDSPRSIAYLRAYIELGERIFYATGIPLADGYVHPDRGIMKSMLIAECVTLDSDTSRFVLTDRGQALLESQML